MASYHLQIVTPDGLRYDGQAEKLIARTVSGEVCILARHINFVTVLGMGECQITTDDGQERRGACIGGMLSVHDGLVRLVPSSFEWAEDIDLDRAKRAEETARELLSHKDGLSERESAMAEAKLRRSLIRQSVVRG